MQQTRQNTYDYIIVGAGSAGCVLANRLSEDPNVSVLLVEAGPKDHRWDWRIHMPAALSHPLQGETYNWAFETTPQKNLDNRRVNHPRGRVLGGSSSINGMIYIRGNPLDYERWAEQDSALSDWDYAHCLPYFKRAENHHDRRDSPYHGTEGPLNVTEGPRRNPLYRAFIDAGVQAGYHETDDLNGYKQEGFGPMDMTAYKGHRQSTAATYLRQAAHRTNLDVQTSAQCTQILMNGREAVGIEYLHKGGRHKVYANREVISSAGPIHGPQLLMLSGLGPKAHLAEHDIPLVQEMPGVGQYFQDHLELFMQYACSEPITLYNYLTLTGKIRTGLEWFLRKTGPGSSNHFEAGGFVRSAAGIKHPDIQYHFLPAAITYDGKNMVSQHGFQAHVATMRAKSRGEIRLASNAAPDKPVIDPNYMSHPDDWREMRAAVRLTREIMQQDALAPYNAGEISPGKDVQSDEEIDAFIKSHVESAYHLCGTCAMGSAEDAVVNTQGQVHGIDNLRVVDSSVVPSVISGNTNAATIMLAEKLADKIRGLSHLKPENPGYWVHPNWESQQR